MRRRPGLLRSKSEQTAREAIHILKDYGFTEDQLKSAILSNPTILMLKVDAQLKPRMEFLKNLCLAPEDMPVIISRCTRLFDSNIEKCLAPNILHLRSLFGSKDDLCKAVRWAPQFLTRDFKKHVIPRVEYVKNDLGIPDGSAAFVRVLGVVLRLSFENLEDKTENLASLGLAAEEIRQILRGNPRVLQSSTKKIKENMDFFIHTAGLMPEIVASRPMILNSSVEKALKPRFEFFKYLRTNPHCKSPPSLVDFLTSKYYVAFTLISATLIPAWKQFLEKQDFGWLEYLVFDARCAIHHEKQKLEGGYEENFENNGEDIQESEIQAVARYVNGLKFQLEVKLTLVKISTVDEA
ncbi:uncharacterized protein LOC131041730 [Cryptomeria japonica]|uniref:uncharacterized protein LOC131041730 n=1 Tax=Cryptomeria japonica TaxID=3369 RepID=UPI0027DA2C0C|nr:uncharacterized protein LOC131041730 [Cryptomeria japonica]